MSVQATQHLHRNLGARRLGTNPGRLRHPTPALMTGPPPLYLCTGLQNYHKRRRGQASKRTLLSRTGRGCSAPKAEAEAQERPVVEQIQSTHLFIARKVKRVEQARQAVVQAREALDKAVAIQQEQEALLADGGKRLTALQEKERTIPSPFYDSRGRGVRLCPSRNQPVAERHRRFTEGVGKFAQLSTRAGHKRRRRRRHDGFPSQEIEDDTQNSISHYRGSRHAIDIQRK